MELTFKIQGIRCAACIEKIKHALAPLMHDIRLTQDPPSLTVLNVEKVLIATLNQRLETAGEYRLLLPTEMPATDYIITSEIKKPGLKIYFPLLLILLYLLSIAFLTSYQHGQINWHIWMTGFMGGFFLIFSAFKFLDLPGFANAYAGYDLLAARWSYYGYLYPFLELALGFAYITDFLPLFTNIFTIILMTFSSLGVLNALMHQRKIPCACLGTVLNLPMSTVTLLEDMGMIIMAIIMLFM